MDYRPPLGAIQRPRAPQRAVSGGSYGSQQLPKRPTLPSRLSNVRSVSQPGDVVDLTADAAEGEKSNAAAFMDNRVKVVSSPDVIELEDDEVEPPTKRIKTEGNRLRDVGDDTTGDGKVTDMVNDVVPGSPLPSLPKANPSLTKSAIPRQNRFGIDQAARKAHGIEPPAAATRVPLPKKVLDFSPWCGNHPEDVLSETVVKAGYFDKLQNANQTESNSAKASIWPNLSQKNHHGLSMLGYLFTAVMEKRQAIGRCTAPLTFKPPPRVTVTDTKREAWLRDLANPDVPLRKQSRTIPHGIRGKLLMEQCLSKAIPLQRAVWLAKCVGANELRAFRRKGVSGSAAASGEVKWVREWTVHVEQFLEGVIGACGQKDWQRSMNYAVKLATAFYAEKLLDVDHYLDSVVSSLAEATLERLPIWIILAQVHWKGITAYGKRGRRFAESILEHLLRISADVRSDVNAPLKARLQKLVAVLAVSNRGCLIIPRTWAKYKHLLSPKAESDKAANTPASDISRRNERLAAPMCKTAATTRSVLLNLYDELDSTGLDVDVKGLAVRCQTLVPDAAKLVSALLDWASTLYRTGTARIYLASGIIVQLRASRTDTDSMILQYLADAKHASDASIINIHRVVVDLVRVEAFSVGRYLQWLITSGVLSSSEESPCATGLIAALPTDELPLHVLSTRKTLMRRLNYIIDENVQLEEALMSIDAAIARSSTEYVGPIELPSQLTMSMQCSISQRVSAKVSAMTKDNSITLGAFGVARDVIERIGDGASLSALIAATCSTNNSALLATLTDTINLHAGTLAALGHLKGLVESLTQHYLALRSQQPPDRTLIIALTALAQRFLDQAALVKLLGDDLAICEQQSSLAVCSPASDSLIGMHATRLDSDEDIDGVFSSGNTMDEQLMQRVFLRIVQRAEKPPSPGPDAVSRVGAWLNQLRSVDGSGTFDTLVRSYLRAMIKSTWEVNLSAAIIESLASSGSISLAAVADMSKDVKSPRIALSLLRLFISDDVANAGLHNSERYRFRLQQGYCWENQTEALVTLVRTACGAPDFEAEHPGLLQFLIRCSAAQHDSLRPIFEGGNLSETVIANAGRIVTAIIRLELPSEQQTKNMGVQRLVSMAGPLSIRYCVGAIRYMMTVARWNPKDDETLGDAIMESFMSHSEVWPQLLEFAGEVVNRRLYEWAQDQLLVTLDNPDRLQDQSAQEHRQRCLNLLSFSNSAPNAKENTKEVNMITDRLKDIERRLSEPKGSEGDLKTDFAGCLCQLRILLGLCILYVHNPSTESETFKHARGDLLAALCSLLVNTRLQTHHDLMESLFDLASTLSDDVPGPTQATLRFRSTNKVPDDPRLTFILGNTVNTADSWLALASQVQPLGSQQQRALNKYSSQPQLSSRSLTSGQPQQSPAQPQHPRWPPQGGPPRSDGRVPVETKMTPFPLRRWEIMPDPTPVMGENDASLSLALFGARKV
ncbi:RNA polymerase II mediator complex subunit [Vermiconidia calcicola]|uniref:RNA polymerase II mediator complex subunit n=1 Tax=Vermiconidia calcicola TaxID=1690605 RepID=A0ACC3MIR6_9PEZI|nr:RNA polymerase II mediator complex subunit [Vermiconidia calcicola]